MNLPWSKMWIGLALALPLNAADTPSPTPEAPDRDAPAVVAAEPANNDTAKPEPAEPADAASPAQPAAPAPPAPAAAPAAAAEAAANAVPDAPPPGANDLRLNFRGVPLDMVLNYLSEAAGFIIILDTEVKGKVDVWSNQPLSRDEAVELLNSVLNKNGYAAIRNGRTLTIVSRDAAKTHDIPVRSGANPDDIPKSDEMVTQIIPVRYISAVPLAKDLQPLLPTQATLSANEGGNALVITDTQTNIRRMAEIVRALDTAIASVSSVRVFKLKYADAKNLAASVSQLFQTQDTARAGQGQGQGRFFNFMRGGGPGGQGGGQAQGGGDSASGGRAPVPRITAVADEYSNALIVNAPEEQMPIIEDMVKEVDQDVEDITELRVFALKYADPQETADLLADLFPDTTSNSQNSRSAVQFGGRFGGGGAGGQFGGGGPGGQMGGRGMGNSGSATSARMQRQSRVLASADLRTGALVVSAPRALMGQIAKMVAELDANPAKKQKVFVYSVENTDPTAVQEIIQNLFPSQNYRNTSSTSRNTTRQTGNQLNNRATQSQNTRSGSTGLGGNSGFGSGSSGQSR